ncbi:MAG: hypothetical protein IT327_18170 [Anaerolineae bacterium]|nr:hypothetical protein [Anaerolineae bacterium]
MVNTAKRNAIIFNLSLVGLCILSCVLFAQLFFNGCIWWECAPARSFDVLDLELPSHLFPDKAIYNSIHLDDDDNPKTLRSSGQTIYWDGRKGLAIYIVDRYATSKNALQNFERTKVSFFSNWNNSILWYKPEELTYVSPLADNFFWGCGYITRSDYRCGMVAQYQEFLLFFNATISEKMSYADFQGIVTFIDENISDHLYHRSER